MWVLLVIGLRTSALKRASFQSGKCHFICSHLQWLSYTVSCSPYFESLNFPCVLFTLRFQHFMFLVPSSSRCCPSFYSFSDPSLLRADCPVQHPTERLHPGIGKPWSHQSSHPFHIDSETNCVSPTIQILLGSECERCAQCFCVNSE